MTELLLNSENASDYVEKSSDGEPFLVLGKRLPKERSLAASARARRRNKIRRRRKSGTADVWGTLGMMNGAGLQWSGRLRFSTSGNERSVPEESMPVTCEQIDLIRKNHPEARAEDLRIVERYISFRDVKIDNPPDEYGAGQVPALRLTVMLGRDEGALVYYQLFPEKRDADYDELTEKERSEVDLEYVQPEPTPGNRCTDRDRLTYVIPVLSRNRIEDVDEDGNVRWSKRSIHENFVLKVLTFTRNNAESRSLLENLHYHIWGRTHELLGWSPQTGAFSGIDGSALHPDRRTLFLLHGTASSTDIAFAGLIEGGLSSWLARQHASAGGPYEQIIGFNHPTFSEDAAANAAAFIDRLPRGFEFRAGTDIISHSRGGLLAKHLALNMSPLHVRTGALVACANGVGYFTVGRRLSRLLSVLRASTTAALPLRWLAALAQHSGDFLMRQPGSVLMTPGSDALNEVLRPFPPGEAPTFLPIVGNFQRGLVGEQPFHRRWLARGLDLLLKPILGVKHDWVVGTRQQYIVEPNCYPSGWSKDKPMPRHVHPSRHSEYFRKRGGAVPNKVPGRIEQFLRRGTSW